MSRGIFYVGLPQFPYCFELMRRWQYSGVEGALVFVADKARGGLCFRVVDLSSGLGVIWDHELPKEIEYNQDKPFFHTWQADVS